MMVFACDICDQRIDVESMFTLALPAYDEVDQLHFCDWVCLNKACKAILRADKPELPEEPPAHVQPELEFEPEQEPKPEVDIKAMAQAMGVVVS